MEHTCYRTLVLNGDRPKKQKRYKARSEKDQQSVNTGTAYTKCKDLTEHILSSDDQAANFFVVVFIKLRSDHAEPH